MAVRKYIYDYETVLQETDGSNVTQKEYTSTTDLYGDLLSAYDGSSAKYYEPDALGSTDALIDESQTVTDRWKYRAFGLATATLGATGNPFTWVGRQDYFNDSETGLYLLGSGTRYYGTDVNQFLSNDPIGFAAGDANLRKYVGNNPTNTVDPSGLYCQLPKPMPKPSPCPCIDKIVKQLENEISELKDDLKKEKKLAKDMWDYWDKKGVDLRDEYWLETAKKRAFEQYAPFRTEARINELSALKSALEKACNNSDEQKAVTDLIGLIEKRMAKAQQDREKKEAIIEEKKKRGEKVQFIFMVQLLQAFDTVEQDKKVLEMLKACLTKEKEKPSQKK